MSKKERIVYYCVSLIIAVIMIWAFDQDQNHKSVQELTIENLKMDNELKRIKLDSLQKP